MTTSSHLALFQLVGLSKRKIIEPSLTAGFLQDFLLLSCLHERSRTAFICHGKSKSSLTAKENSVTAKENSLTTKAIRLQQKQIAHGKNTDQLRMRYFL